MMIIRVDIMMINVFLSSIHFNKRDSSGWSTNKLWVTTFVRNAGMVGFEVHSTHLYIPALDQTT